MNWSPEDYELVYNAIMEASAEADKTPGIQVTRHTPPLSDGRIIACEAKVLLWDDSIHVEERKFYPL